MYLYRQQTDCNELVIYEGMKRGFLCLLSSTHCLLDSVGGKPSIFVVYTVPPSLAQELALCGAVDSQLLPGGGGGYGRGTSRGSREGRPMVAVILVFSPTLVKQMTMES